MGLGGMKYAWQRQTKDFGHTKGDQYTSLVLDNRGIGESDKPLFRYSTSEMAKDVIEVIDHLGWTGQRELHVIGISMGGMIAQELVSSVSQIRRPHFVLARHTPHGTPHVHNASSWSKLLDCAPDLG